MRSPSQPKNCPVSAGCRRSITCSSCETARSTPNSLPSGTLPWKGRDRSVSVVPGCRADADDVAAAARPLDCERPRVHVLGRLGGAIRVPAAQAIVLDAADACRQARKDGPVRMRQQRLEMPGYQQRSDRVDRKCAGQRLRAHVGQPLLRPQARGGVVQDPGAVDDEVQTGDRMCGRRGGRGNRCLVRHVEGKDGEAACDAGLPAPPGRRRWPANGRWQGRGRPGIRRGTAARIRGRCRGWHPGSGRCRRLRTIRT